ncbi:probable arginine--tRNA ligase, mitochondrial [Liolophura sinensis]|uniref:probable arginine--tRNA ligase, mitochondrial n=1 Tax=Liolophura sinensis TaxID=3198878 RepID=UPI00315867C3
MLLHSVMSFGERYGQDSEVFRYKRGKGGIEEVPHLKVVFEYSSPNIAKPFHAGHLRSTVIGHVLANLCEASGHMVTRLNYLGDWGTQFGLLTVGLKRYGNSEALKSSPMEHLFEVYVKVNSDVSREAEGGNKTSTPTQREGLDIFRQLENGDTTYLDQWQELRDLSVKEYRNIYKRLGVWFDEYHGEAMYVRSAQDVINRWRNMGLLEFEKDTGVGYVDMGQHLGHSSRAKVLKSDGTSLYLTRDIAAILDRFERYQFDKIHYVVDSGQVLYFRQMAAVLNRMQTPWLNKVRDTLHVPFGRVDGMSTRRGNVVFLKDILDESKSRMLQTIYSKETSKPVDDVDSVADVLGVSAVIVQGLKEKRQKSYTFSWEKVLNFKSDSGVFLQYSHARLSSLAENCGVSLSEDFSAGCLTEPEAQRLVLHLTGFDTAIHEAYQELEPCILVQYLFKLGHLSNTALSCLQVKGQSTDTAQARLWLFMCSRQTLRNGLHLLGIQPLDKM